MKINYDAFCCVQMSRFFYEKRPEKINILHIGGYDGSWDVSMNDTMDGIPLEIYSIEPHPINHAKMLEAFQGHENLHAFHCAAGAYIGKGFIYGASGAEDQGASLIPETIESLDCKRTKIRVATIPWLMHRCKMPIFDFMRVNCEGGEFDIFCPDADLNFLDSMKIIELCLHGKSVALESSVLTKRKQRITNDIREHGFDLVRGYDFSSLEKVPRGHIWQVYVKKGLFEKEAING